MRLLFKVFISIIIMFSSFSNAADNVNPRKISLLFGLDLGMGVAQLGNISNFYGSFVEPGASVWVFTQSRWGAHVGGIGSRILKLYGTINYRTELSQNLYFLTGLGLSNCTIRYNQPGDFSSAAQIAPFFEGNFLFNKSTVDHFSPQYSVGIYGLWMPNATVTTTAADGLVVGLLLQYFFDITRN